MIDVLSVIGLTIIIKPLTRCGIPSTLYDANHSEYVSVCVGHRIITVNVGVRKTTSYRRTF